MCFSVLVLALAFSIRCHSEILASSRLEKCVRDVNSAESEQVLDCQEKLVVTLTLGSGAALATEELQLGLACVGSSDGRCPCSCNYATDAGCGCRDLQQALSLRLTKSVLAASYPLTYLQSFNYKPTEIILRPSDNRCRDGDLEENPTCGWYYAGGKKLADSQGFCCECSTGQVFDDTFGGSNKRTRANLNCDFFSDPLDILLGKKPVSAHCLDFDPLWFGGYLLGEAGLQFQIDLQLNMTTSGGGTQQQQQPNAEKLVLSPSVPLARSASGQLLAKLLGDLASYSQLPVLSEKVLAIPQPDGWALDKVLRGNKTQWMLIDKSRISFDGAECDKVGTSFAAFRFQASGCGRAPGSCLRNQLKDLYEADRERVASGKTPLFLLSQHTYGAAATVRSFAGGPLSLSLPVTTQRNSIVVLTAVADSLRLIENAAPGRISFARLCQFEEVACGGFEAAATSGFLHANVSNLGLAAARFTLTVSNCSMNIRPVEAQVLALPPGGATPIIPFRIWVEDSAAVEDRRCWLTLFDSQARVTDRSEVVFYTNATIFDDKPTGGYDGDGDGEGDKARKDCDKSCSNAFDVLCFVKNRCFGKFGKLLGMLGGVLTAAGLLLLALKYGWLMSLAGTLARLCCCCSGGSSGGSGGGGCGGGGGERRQSYKPDENKRQQRQEDGGKKRRPGPDQQQQAQRYYWEQQEDMYGTQASEPHNGYAARNQGAPGNLGLEEQLVQAHIRNVAAGVGGDGDATATKLLMWKMWLQQQQRQQQTQQQQQNRRRAGAAGAGGTMMMANPIFEASAQRH